MLEPIPGPLGRRRGWGTSRGPGAWWREEDSSALGTRGSAMVRELGVIVGRSWDRISGSAV